MTLNPVPVCVRCGSQTRRAGTTAGKGRYCCTSTTCPDAFKVWYVRGSNKVGATVGHEPWCTADNRCCTEEEM